MEAVTSAIRKHATLWLAWTAAGLFYFTQNVLIATDEPRARRPVSVGRAGLES